MCNACSSSVFVGIFIFMVFVAELIVREEEGVCKTGFVKHYPAAS